MLKTYSGAVNAGVGNGVENEIFIPIGDLSGSFTLNDANSKVNYARGLLMFSQKLAEVMAPSTFQLLGQTVSAVVGNGAGLLHTFAYSFASTVYSSTNPADGLTKASVLPVAQTGTQAGFGDYSFKDVFPNSTKVAAEGAISGAGISFVVSDLVEYGTGAYADINLNSDSRQLMMAIWQDLSFNQVVRAAGVTSAITASSLSGVNNVPITSAQLAVNNGTVGLTTAQLDNIIAGSRTSSWTIQCILNTETNTYDVNVA